MKGNIDLSQINNKPIVANSIQSIQTLKPNEQEVGNSLNNKLLGYDKDQNELYISQAKKIFDKLQIKNSFIRHLFRINKINFNDIKSARKILLKAKGAFFFTKLFRNEIYKVLYHWKNFINEKISKNKERQIDKEKVRPQSLDYFTIRNCRSNYYSIPVVPLSQLAKNRLLHEVGFNCSNNSNMSPQKNNTFSIQRRDFYFDDNKASPCQYKHGEAVLAANIYRGKNNYEMKCTAKERNKSFSNNYGRKICEHIYSKEFLRRKPQFNPTRNFIEMNFDQSIHNLDTEGMKTSLNANSEVANLASLKRNLMNYLYSIFLGAVQYSEAQRRYFYLVMFYL